MERDKLSYQVRGCIFQVHAELGPGMLESTYHTALVFELTAAGLNVQTQHELPVYYKGIRLNTGYKADILVEDQLILELKSVEALHDIHKKQLLAYLKTARKKLGILVNFNVVSLQDKVSLVRIIN